MLPLPLAALTSGVIPKQGVREHEMGFSRSAISVCDLRVMSVRRASRLLHPVSRGEGSWVREETVARAVVATVRLEANASYDNGIPDLPH